VSVRVVPAPAAVATAVAGLLAAAVTTGVVLHRHSAEAPTASGARAAVPTVVPTDAAGRRLAAIALPPATQRCPDDATASLAVVCWHGSVEPQVTSGYLLAGLREVGSSDVRGRCIRQPVLGPMCEVRATVAGKQFRALITRPLAKGGHGTAPGSDLVGDTMSGAGPLPSGTPLAIPQPPG
jgi:hypothetical protein